MKIRPFGDKKLAPALLICFGLFSGSQLLYCATEQGKEPAILKCAAVQMRSTRDLAANSRRIAKSIQDTAAKGARVVVFPECALTGYFEDTITNLSTMEITNAASQVYAACRNAHVYAIVGSAWREGDAFYDSALIIDPAGRLIERYDKMQLAEKWPRAGDKLFVFQIDGVPCSVMICHDERYPELVRLPVLAGAKLIFYVSHESGLDEQSKIGPYRAQIQARAVENNVFIIQANAPANPDKTGSHGQSRIIAPDGNVLQESSISEEDILIGTLDLKRATRSNALNSLKRGPLAAWWAEGLKHVKRVE
jgi:predicted amidohydrolase